MDSQLYLKAKRQEPQREPAWPAGETAAQGSASRHAEEQETIRGRDIMLLTKEHVKATVHMKEEETHRAHLIPEAREQAQQNRNGRAWRWRIEPSMEDAFQDLQGWLLSSQRDAEMETANSPPGPSPRAGSEGRLASEPDCLTARWNTPLSARLRSLTSFLRLRLSFRRL
jgi:hypothetical protein